MKGKRRNFPFPNASTACVAAVFVFLGLMRSDTAWPQFAKAGTPHVVMSPARAAKLGVSGWPDSNLSSFLFEGRYYVFASNANLTATQGLTTSDLNSLGMSYKSIRSRALPKGKKGAFDQNYAGGGAFYYDSSSGILIELYHGEYWYGGGPVQWLPAYASLGIAFSKDLGRSWKKLGEVISTAAPRTNRCQSDIGNGSLLLRSDGYLYAYYSDLAAPCQNPGIGLARAKLSDIVKSAEAGAFPAGSGSVFMKYYNGSFNQPGVINPLKPALGGGSFTPMFSYSGEQDQPTMSSVAYDEAIQQYVMAYVAGWQNPGETGIALRFSRDGIEWGDATILHLGDSAFYPALLNTERGDPNTLGSSFYIYYVSPFPSPSAQNLMRAKITLAGVDVSSNN